MVKDNHIIYVNEKQILRSIPLSVTNDNGVYTFDCTIKEKHLVCGLIIDGKPIKGDRIKDFPFKPIEKYLFEFTNVWFKIPDVEYRVENENLHFTITDLFDTFPTFYFSEPKIEYHIDENRSLKIKDSEAIFWLDNFNTNYVYIHFSYDGILFKRFEIFGDLNFVKESGSGIYFGSFFDDSANVILLETAFGVAITNDMETLPKYCFFSDDTAKKSKVFEIPILPAD